MTLKSEGLQGIRWRPAVPEDARANLPGETERLVPLHLIDVLWAHLHFDVLHELQEPSLLASDIGGRREEC